MDEDASSRRQNDGDVLFRFKGQQPPQQHQQQLYEMRPMSLTTRRSRRRFYCSHSEAERQIQAATSPVAAPVVIVSRASSENV